MSVWGLSPRVRGNPYMSGLTRIMCGPIPACAGQPAEVGVQDDKLRAYPRVCGATFIAQNHYGVNEGLSPRVRGNPFRQRRK